MDAATVGAIGTMAGAILLGVAAVVAAAKKRENDNDERLVAQVAAERRHGNDLMAALARANKRLIKAGLSPEDYPEGAP